MDPLHIPSFTLKKWVKPNWVGLPTLNKENYAISFPDAVTHYSSVFIIIIIQSYYLYVFILIQTGRTPFTGKVDIGVSSVEVKRFPSQFNLKQICIALSDQTAICKLF